MASIEGKIVENMTVINTVKEFLDSQGITPYRFGKDAGLAPKTAYDLYNKPEQLPSPDVLRKICDCYKVQPGVLMKWQENGGSND